MGKRLDPKTKAKNELLRQKLRERARLEMVNAFLKAKRKHGSVSRAALQEQGVSPDRVDHHFNSMSGLEKKAREVKPDLFFDTYLHGLRNEKSLKAFGDKIDKYDRFIITTAGVGREVDENFLAAIRQYCAHNKAALLVLVAADPASTTSWTVDKQLSDDLVLDEVQLNSNLFISTIKVSTKQIDPLTGLEGMGQGKGSFIFASPKQFLRFVPTSNEKMPRAIMTTGAITKPQYRPTINKHRYLSERTAYIADLRHVMGAIIVEIADNQVFHFRQVQADKSGSFIDLGTQYNAEEKPKKIETKAFILGDWHSGQTDPRAKRCWLEVCQQLKPTLVVLHDAFNGLSINHHEDGKFLLKARRAANGCTSLSEEIKTLANDLSYLVKNYSKNIVVVKSNHDEFLERYLESGFYIQDRENQRVALGLALASHNGFDPLRFGAEAYLPKDIVERVSWLGRDDDFRVAGCQLAAHGDVGPKGGVGNLRNHELAYGNCIIGHSHTPGIYHKAWQVGTSSLMDMEYNEGPGNWVHSSCLLYANGSKQLINVINGKWRNA